MAKKEAAVPERIGRPIAPDGEDLYYCEECDALFRDTDLKPMHHAWSEHADGDEFHPYVCSECGATVTIADATVDPFDPTTENLKKHAFHDGIEIVFTKTMKAPTMRCKQCERKKTYKVEEDEIGVDLEEEDA